METGQTRTTRIEPENGYGERRDDMILEVPADQLPDGLNPQVGQELQLQLQDGQQLPVVVTTVENDSVTIDANHPLAGQSLTFDVELVGVS